MAQKIHKILIIELWGIGDVVMMSAVLKPLRRAFPDAQITVLCQEHGQQTLKYNKEITSFVTFKFPWTAFRGKYRFWNWDWRGIFSTIGKLRQEKFDLVLDGRGDARDDLLVFLIGAKQYMSAPHQRTSHRVDCWIRLLERIGITQEQSVPSIAVSTQEQLVAQAFVQDHFTHRPRKLVGIHPGASQSVKRWPLDRFKELVERLKKVDDIGIILFSDQEGHGARLGHGSGLPVFTGNIRELTALLSQLNVLVCNDTGVMHIASAVDVPVIAIFGPGDSKIFSPRGKAEVLSKNCDHRPCFGECGKQTADCLLKITVDDVWGVLSNKI